MTRQQRRAEAFKRAFAQVNRDTTTRVARSFKQNFTLLLKRGDKTGFQTLRTVTVPGRYAWSRDLRRAAARNMAKA